VVSHACMAAFGGRGKGTARVRVSCLLHPACCLCPAAGMRRGEGREQARGGRQRRRAPDERHGSGSPHPAGRGGGRDAAQHGSRAAHLSKLLLQGLLLLPQRLPGQGLLGQLCLRPGRPGQQQRQEALRVKGAGGVVVSSGNTLPQQVSRSGPMQERPRSRTALMLPSPISWCLTRRSAPSPPPPPPPPTHPSTHPPTHLVFLSQLPDDTLVALHQQRILLVPSWARWAGRAARGGVGEAPMC
jgi:hypothetical protein